MFETLRTLLTSKKGQGILDSGMSTIIGLVTMGMVAGVGLIALTQFQASTTANTSAYYGIGNATYGISQFLTQLPTFGIIAGIMLIFALVAFYFMRGRR